MQELGRGIDKGDIEMQELGRKNTIIVNRNWDPWWFKLGNDCSFKKEAKR